MEFNQATLKQFGTHLQASYQKMVDFEVPAADPVSTAALPQMPHFQIKNFLEQALTKDLNVTVQFNDFDHAVKRRSKAILNNATMIGLSSLLMITN